MKKLPIGISTLSEIINENYIYVDKTTTALNLIETGKYYFLSRPRRFGKSLFLDTLKEIFYGNKELFKGLYIYDKYSFEKHPVIRISFGDGNIESKEDLNKKIFVILKENQNELGIEIENTDNDVSDIFREMIIKTYKKYGKRVVILVDEYDKPILDNIEHKEVAREIRDELKGFYSVIKNSDEYLKFVFLTGVSKFSKVSLFSGLNNLNDITLDKNYATICGYTQSELEYSFKEYLKGQDFDKIRQWYNGYKWLGESVYNPFDILLFIQKGYVYSNYWFSTATPTFLLKLIEKNNYFIPDFENIILDETSLGSFDVDNIQLEALMWQTGYLTIDRVENLLNIKEYYMKIPNLEVEISLMSEISEFLTKSVESKKHSNNMLRALLKKDMQSFEISLTSLYASIANNNFTNNKMYEYEGYYVSVFYSYIKALGLDIKNEDPSNKGRIDITIILPETIYIVEFKTDGGGALKQIKEKKYHQKYVDTGKEIILLGIEFDKQEKNISKVEYEKVR